MSKSCNQARCPKPLVCGDPVDRLVNRWLPYYIQSLSVHIYSLEHCDNKERNNDIETYQSEPKVCRLRNTRRVRHREMSDSEPNVDFYNRQQICEHFGMLLLKVSLLGSPPC